jgi:hypothetical protein
VLATVEFSATANCPVMVLMVVLPPRFPSLVVLVVLKFMMVV